jgi:hypothetical protein
MKKTLEKICGNCKLFNPDRGECCVVILHEGQRLKLPMSPSDKCFFEEEYFDPTTKALENFSQEIQQVKFWVENEKGEKTNEKGTVKIEYPEGFFGDNIQKIID